MNDKHLKVEEEEENYWYWEYCLDEMGVGGMETKEPALFITQVYTYE